MLSYQHTLVLIGSFELAFAPLSALVYQEKMLIRTIRIIGNICAGMITHPLDLSLSSSHPLDLSAYTLSNTLLTHNLYSYSCILYSNPSLTHPLELSLSSSHPLSGLHLISLSLSPLPPSPPSFDITPIPSSLTFSPSLTITFSLTFSQALWIKSNTSSTLASSHSYSRRYPASLRYTPPVTPLPCTPSKPLSARRSRWQ